MWFTALLLPVTIASASALDPRAVQTDAICKSTFSWMDNSRNLSPCFVAGQLLGSCQSGNWHVPALTANNHYDAPNATTRNTCSCSWAAYNLLSACAACQDLDSSVLTWSAYSAASCGGLIVDEYFPSNVTLPTDTAVPWWAAVNPTQWINARFNTDQAKALDAEGKNDIIQATATISTAKSKPPVGPIVGGVIGGVFLVIGLLGVVWLLRRRRAAYLSRSEKHNGQWEHSQPVPYNNHPSSHGRNVSNGSTKASFFGRPMLGLRNLVSPTSPTETMLDSSVGSPEQGRHPRLPDLPSRTSDQQPAEDLITPFSLTQSTPPGLITPGSTKDSHGANGSYGYFDEHGARVTSPTNMLFADAVPRPPESLSAGSERVVSAGDVSLNSMSAIGHSHNHSYENAFPTNQPPAYSPSPGPGSGHGHAGSSGTSPPSTPMGHRKGQTSVDSLDSLGSGFGNVTAVDRMSTVPEASENQTGTGVSAALMARIRERDRERESRDGEVDLPDIA